MTHMLDHSFEVRKTQFISEKDHCDADGVSLELLDSTCLLNYEMNRNNVLGGNNIIYLNGSYVTFYNFFQNNKQFGAIVCPHKPVGMVGNNSGRGIVAIVTQKEDKSEMNISVYSFCQEYVPTHTIRKVLNFIDIVMVRANYLVVAAMDPTTNEHIVYIFNSKTVSALSFLQPIKRLVCQDHKICIIFEEGGLHQLDLEKFPEKEDIIIEHADKNIDDYCEIDNEAKVFLYEGSKLYCYWIESEKEFILDFSKQVEKCKANRIIKVGRNILVTHRNSITITHLVMGDDNIVFGGNHTYQDKLKGGILSIQSSQDQMHAVLAVEVIEKEETKVENFIFNLSSISKSHKFISPFTRLLSMGSDFGSFCTMENVLSSNSYVLIGSRIYNLFNSTILQRKQSFNLYETPKFMTVHPLGHQFLCGFDSIIKFYHKVEKDMQQVWSEQFICTAAKYSKSGGLVLSCVEDAFTTLILYDCYNFRKLRVVPIPMLKLCATRIEWSHNNTALVLYSSNEVCKINLFNGEKISEFRDKKDGPVIKSIDYDPYYDRLIAATNSNCFLIASKGETNSYNLGNVKMVSFPEQVTCIKISQGLKTIFFGCRSGTLYWGNYPLKIKSPANQGQSNFELNQDLQKIKLHNLPIISIDHTSNNKFMLVSVQGQGYFSFRMRKLRSKEANAANMNVLFQELGNPVLNTIETSSTINYANNKEKLKISLEKRKQCFSDLEQFRREWDIKFVLSSKEIQMQAKKNELAFINETLASIEEIKQKKKAVQVNIDRIVEEMELKKNNRELSYVKQMLDLYEEQQKQKCLFEQKKKSYDSEYQQLVNQCNQNLKSIETDLASKRSDFQKNYRVMLKNLQDFNRRFLFEKQEEPEQKRLEIQQHLKNLQVKEIELTKLSNDLSIKITQSRKQYQRYCNRKCFLEMKNNFFFEENIKCVKQKTKLLDLKQKLESQLKQLETYTDKKQKKLRVYLKTNEALRKYKQIHENLSENAVREAEFIKAEQQKIDQNIVEIQRQLSSLASTNETSQSQIHEFEEQIQRLKSESVKLNMKMKSVGYYFSQILGAMSDIGYNKNETERLEKLKRIYNYFYVERNVESLIERETKCGPNYEKNMLNERNEKLRSQQSKILSQLKDQKNYLIHNMQVCKSYNNRINEEINLNFLQIQAQNYNLIAECNLRKEQTANKKKALHQLIDSVKQTQIYLDQMKKQTPQAKRLKKQRKTAKAIVEVPYIIFEREKQQKVDSMKLKVPEEGDTAKFFSNFRPASHKIYGPNVSIRKMLNIKSIEETEQKIGLRRIQTAKIKKVEVPQFVQQKERGIIKPMTASLKGRQGLRSALSIKNKSSSKPSTCATFSQIKYSIAQ